MNIVRNSKHLQEILSSNQNGKKIGFVPTMGALHEGHASLLQRAKTENEIVVLSIFVNPTQFGKNEDFSKYPRTFEADCELARKHEVDIIFYPSEEEIYPEGYSTYITVEKITEKLCGEFRPGHFRGVATVVYRLFQLVRPDRAYFGQKDIQQCLVIERMVKDLRLGMEIVVCPTLREPDGLAMSSRNRYLNPSDREKAPKLWEVLQAVEQKILGGEKSVETLLKFAREEIAKEKRFTLQYFEILSYPDLDAIVGINSSAVIAVAIFLGETRLIDNLLIKK